MSNRIPGKSIAKKKAYIKNAQEKYGVDLSDFDFRKSYNDLISLCCERMASGLLDRLFGVKPSNLDLDDL